LGFKKVDGVAGLSIFRQSVSSELYEWLLAEQKRRNACIQQRRYNRAFSHLILGFVASAKITHAFMYKMPKEKREPSGHL